MFQVDVDNLKDYFDFDLKRKHDLHQLDKLIRRSASSLKRYFHGGTPAGEPGMRFKMIGYGRMEYFARTGQPVEWPAVGVALQKNYISVYLSLTKGETPLLNAYRGKLGELRAGSNNFSFEAFNNLDARVLARLFAEAEQVYLAELSRCSLAHGGTKRARRG